MRRSNGEGGAASHLYGEDARRAEGAEGGEGGGGGGGSAGGGGSVGGGGGLDVLASCCFFFLFCRNGLNKVALARRMVL